MKRLVPHFTRWQFACDAVPEIKEVEAANPAALATGKAVIDAQEAGVAPRNIGVDVDKDASIDEIVLKLFPGASPEDTETIINLYKKYKTAPATVEVEDGEDVPAGTLPVAGEAAPVKDGEETPAEQKAFAEGVKYGEEKEKAEPEHLDSLHESEGMKKALGEATDAEGDGETYSKEEVDAKIAALMKDMEAKIEAAKAKATDEAKEHYEGLSKAAQDCAPLLKITDPMSYKSAAAIYRKALKLRGFAADSVPASALPAMVDFVKKSGGTSARPAVATDSAPVSSGDDAILKTLESRIKVY